MIWNVTTVRPSLEEAKPIAKHTTGSWRHHWAKTVIVFPAAQTFQLAQNLPIGQARPTFLCIQTCIIPQNYSQNAAINNYYLHINPNIGYTLEMIPILLFWCFDLCLTPYFTYSQIRGSGGDKKTWSFMCEMLISAYCLSLQNYRKLEL